MDDETRREIQKLNTSMSGAINSVADAAQRQAEKEQEAHAEKIRTQMIELQFTMFEKASVITTCFFWPVTLEVLQFGRPLADSFRRKLTL